MERIGILLKLQKIRSLMMTGEWSKAYEALLAITDTLIEEERIISRRALCAKEMRKAHPEIEYSSND